ncbi:histone acetyltransferase, putative [Talaromyces stipitatus ATCC 10500]|uniref:Histone acetyltransferase n=1 Tax=Talaromyces stipitatus (strain ATCC 10500 / CBS 375.48 / QM 6759 / NRRL 1006) TaxID=441959 RepID=B8LW12_TALSN|nr:histone acetyltransferase, putative [Talaromyces stipitatus ATCC 10500]EED24378.1 histone acetyltransferase, putative [Talaromyces stipitatus ATCC 10500]
MAAIMPASHEELGVSSHADDRVDSDQDAEGEEDTDLYQLDQELQSAVQKADAGDAEEATAESDSGEDNQSEEDYAEQANDDDAVSENEYGIETPRRPRRGRRSAAVSSKADDDESDPDVAFGNGDAHSDSESNESDGEAEDWEAESNGKDENEDADKLLRSNCIFCGQDEDHDPSEDFEEYLTCAVCGDHSHRQCAREQSAFSDNEDAEQWRCTTCVQDNLQPDPVENDAASRRSAAESIARNLQAASADGQHSVFNNLIVDDDPMDGTRSLRKRRASSDDPEDHVPVLRKRQRRTPSQGATDSADGLLDTDGLRNRPRRKRKAEKELCRIVESDVGKCIIALHLSFVKIAKILNSRPRPFKARRRRQPKPPPVEDEPLAHFAPITSSYTTPFYSFHDREVDELKSKPYGGILSEADADTSRTLPTQADRERFEAARRSAEEDWQRKLMESEPVGEVNHRASQKVSGPPSKIKWINFGGYEIETWYAAPYPEEYSRNKVLYICEFCLKYMNSDFVAWRHKLKCPAKHPPGDEIYRDGSVSIYEVDGRKNPVYCQNLCLLAKLFLGSKTLYYDVEPFLFYVMTEYDELGCHFVGYFSKEKRPSSSNNVSCILTLPIHQRKGYGNLLIDFSYLLTRVEKKTGSPEKPLSDMGLVSYRNYWRLVLSYQLRNQKTPVSIAELSERTGMTADDIVSGLEGLRALVRDPVTKTYALRLNYSYFEDYIKNWEIKGYVRLNPDALVWTPYVMGRSNQSHYDRAQLHTVAPRDDPNEDDEEGADEDGELGLGARRVNGDSTTKPDGVAAYAPAGPPSTTTISSFGENHAVASQTNGEQQEETEKSKSKSPDPAAGIPPTRFEIYPPVQPPVFKRRPGRPWGSKTKYNSSYMSTPRGARATPRRTSTSMFGIGSPASTNIATSARRGRSGLVSEIVSGPDSPSVGVDINGTDNQDHTEDQSANHEEEGEQNAELVNGINGPEDDATADTDAQDNDQPMTNGSAATAVIDSNDNTAATNSADNLTPRRTRRSIAKGEKKITRTTPVKSVATVTTTNGNSDSDIDADGEIDEDVQMA